MLKPIDKEAAFAAIAEDLELPLVLLSNPDPRVQLDQIRKIGDALLSTNLTFRDLAERVTGRRPAASGHAVAAVPPLPTAPLRPASEIEVGPGVTSSPGADDTPADPSTTAVEAERQAFGHRASPPPYLGRYGFGRVPDTFEMLPGESDEAAGQRLANWAVVRSGEPLWEDQETGMGYLPGVTVPGKGKVQPDGRLGPLPVEG